MAKYEIMTEFIEITKALSDPNRVRALMALRHQELCVCRIIELLQLAPSTVSKHLTILRQAGLIEGRKEGRWMHYRLSDHPRPEIRNGLGWVFQSLENSPAIQVDEARLEQIAATDLDQLTQIYKK
jgi:ArsR family transcriptional regulator